DPYEEATQQLLEQAPRSPEYIPEPIELEDHVPLHIPEHHEDLVPAKNEAPIEAYIPEPGPTMARSVDCSFVDTMETRFRDSERRMMTALEMVNMRVSYQTREALARSEAYSRALEARVAVLETQKMAPKRTTRSTQASPVAPAPTATTTTITEAQLQALIDRGVAAAMAEAVLDIPLQPHWENDPGKLGAAPDLL
nr:hypothetical protein [Tanacetum cinerariifolium]